MMRNLNYRVESTDGTLEGCVENFMHENYTEDKTCPFCFENSLYVFGRNGVKKCTACRSFLHREKERNRKRAETTAYYLLKDYQKELNESNRELKRWVL